MKKILPNENLSLKEKCIGDKLSFCIQNLTNGCIDSCYKVVFWNI